MKRKFGPFKLRCIEDLKLPASALSFVGELITIKAEVRQEFELAVESALQPISRNLLCLPEYLNKAAKWINSEGLQRTVVVKRISPEELEAELREKLPKNSVLEKIEILQLRKNPFFHYLWRWVIRDFNHTIVDLEEIKKLRGRLVTRQGLVKSDERTLRKLKSHFEYSLGWSPEEKIRSLIAELLSRNTEIDNLKARKTKTNDREDKLAQQLTAIAKLRDTEVTYLDLRDLEAGFEKCEEELARLEKKKGHRAKKLESDAEELQKKFDEEHKILSQLKGDLERAQKALLDSRTVARRRWCAQKHPFGPERDTPTVTPSRGEDEI